jgi:hypothetical protein
MRTLKTFENFPGSGLPDDYQSKTGDMSGEHKHRHTHSEESKVYTKDDVINLMYDFKLKELGKFNSNTDEEWNFTNPNGRDYVSLDRIKSKIVDFMNNK